MLVTVLSVITIAMSVSLILGVEHVRRGARESFQGTISGTDLIVGPRSGPLQLLLYTVFHMGSPVSNISMDSFEHFKNHPAVEWAIPISLGDSHRGFRVVATDESFYEHFQYRNKKHLALKEGKVPVGVFDVVLGSDVAGALRYHIGDKIVLTHGITGIAGIMDHRDKPFVITGILNTTSTPIDRSLYITLEGMEAIHMDWKDGAPPPPSQRLTPEQIKKMNIHTTEITAFFLGAKSRIFSLRLQREINDYGKEALMGILPGVTLSEFWRSISYGENALLLVLVFVIITGFTGILMTIYSTLNERRREMSILRALGAGPAMILALFSIESGLLTLSGSILGVGIMYSILYVLQPIIENEFGIYIAITLPGWIGQTYLMVIVAGGFLVGLLPAWKAYSNALHDGLSIRV